MSCTWRRRICFVSPTRSSSTLCFRTQDVSINLLSNAMAMSFPSKGVPAGSFPNLKSHLAKRPPWSAPDQLYWRREAWLFCVLIVDWKGSGGCHRPCWNFSCHQWSRPPHRPGGRTSSKYSQPENEKYLDFRPIFWCRALSYRHFVAGMIYEAQLHLFLHLFIVNLDTDRLLAVLLIWPPGVKVLLPLPF